MTQQLMSQNKNNVIKAMVVIDVVIIGMEVPVIAVISTAGTAEPVRTVHILKLSKIILVEAKVHLRVVRTSPRIPFPLKKKWIAGILKKESAGSSKPRQSSITRTPSHQYYSGFTHLTKSALGLAQYYASRIIGQASIMGIIGNYNSKS